MTINIIQNNNQETLINSILCPICYLAMLPPLRTPMIIPECGHTICQQCLSKVNKCPLCYQKIKKPIINVFVLQFVDSVKNTLSIPQEINPPPPFPNKLIPKIDYFCTFAASSSKSIKQKLYHCRTCRLAKFIGFCEICANKCHKDHDIYLDNTINTYYCQCQNILDCQCFHYTSELRCIHELTYGYPVEQPMYQCESCHITNNYYLCQNCAIKCHHGHKLIYAGIHKDKLCHCFDQCLCKISIRMPLCTYIKTGIKSITQPCYYCRTCGVDDYCKCCSACANYCHKGHQLEFVGLMNFSCQCFEKHECKCGIEDEIYDNQSYLTLCSNFSYEKEKIKVKQRKYICYTCGIIDANGICEACAINCHINHSIKYVGIETFCCFCSSTKNCQKMMIPLLHNDRSGCDRQVLNEDDVSACYTCYTCDKTGQMKICETCALQKHSDHDIHLVGYMKFNCSAL